MTPTDDELRSMLEVCERVEKLAKYTGPLTAQHEEDIATYEKMTIRFADTIRALIAEREARRWRDPVRELPRDMNAGNPDVYTIPVLCKTANGTHIVASYRTMGTTQWWSSFRNFRLEEIVGWREVEPSEVTNGT